MPSFFDALSYEFLRNALLAGVIASVLCGVVGTFVVVKRL
ncbi:MAG TPA: metal ABC transporter permease, partial [Thermoanaerobaculia bacterium]